MALFAKIDRTTLTVLARQHFESPELVDVPGKPKWVPVTENPKPPFNPASEKLVREETVSLSAVRVTWTKTALSQTELDNLDRGAIRNATLDLGFILVRVVDILLAKNIIIATDFDAATRQGYLDLKTRVDNLRP